MAFFFCIESKPIHASNGSTDSIHAYVMDYSIREHEIKKKEGKSYMYNNYCRGKWTECEFIHDIYVKRLLSITCRFSQPKTAARNYKTKKSFTKKENEY